MANEKMTKFKEGDMVKAKINDKKFIIVSTHREWFTRRIYYQAEDEQFEVRHFYACELKEGDS